MNWQWQYKTIVLPSSAADRESLLSVMGLDCWELVGFEQGLAYFKRPKPDEMKIPAELKAEKSLSEIPKPNPVHMKK